MNMFQSCKALGVVAAMSGVVSSFGAVTLGDDVAEVFFTLNTSASFESNVTSDYFNKIDDFIFRVRPGVEVDFAPGVTNAELKLIGSYAISRYADNGDEFDNELINIALRGAYNADRWNVSTNLSFREADQASDDGVVDDNIAGTLVEREYWSGGVNGEYELTAKMSLAAGFTVTNTHYVNPDSLLDRTEFVVPVNLYYAYSEKLDLSIGYQRSDTEIENTANRSQNFFNIGARGQIVPKLLANARIGYNYADTGVDNQGSLAYQGDFTYLLSEKARVVLGVNRSNTSGGTGAEISRTGSTLRGFYDYSALITFDAFLGYELAEYENSNGLGANVGREDEIFRAGTGVSYRANEYLTLSGDYRYVNNSSDAPSAVVPASNGYTNHIFSVSANVRY